MTAEAEVLELPGENGSDVDRVSGHDLTLAEHVRIDCLFVAAEP
jgi:hypothetical protein